MCDNAAYCYIFESRYMKYVLPNKGEKREALRAKGQFWTPMWVADAMVAYVLREDADCIFDPAVGEGAFFHAAKRIALRKEKTIELRGTELDQRLIDDKLSIHFSPSELKGIAYSGPRI